MNTHDSLRLRLVARREEAQGIFAFEFVAADGGDLPAFDAGAHIDLRLPNGLLRPYSLCNDPAERHRYVLGVLREPQSRGGSSALHEQVTVGAVLPAGLPRNLFPLAGDARRSVLLAGGIGITPLLAMAQTLASQERDYILHYATRSSRHAGFLTRLRQPDLAPRVRLHHDDGPPAQRFDAARAIGDPDSGTHLYVCGPAGFIEHVVALAEARGWPREQVHTESFSPMDVAAAAGNQPFDMVLASSGQILHVPADRSAADVLAEHGVAIPVSCEQGICGTCITTVLEGQADHRDGYLTDADRARGDCFTPCCSRARGERLVLDL